MVQGCSLIALLITGPYYHFFLNQACAGRRPVRAWFLKITSVRMCVCVCVCVCVHPRGHE